MPVLMCPPIPHWRSVMRHSPVVVSWTALFSTALGCSLQVVHGSRCGRDFTKCLPNHRQWIGKWPVSEVLIGGYAWGASVAEWGKEEIILQVVDPGCYWKWTSKMENLEEPLLLVLPDCYRKWIIENLKCPCHQICPTVDSWYMHWRFHTFACWSGQLLTVDDCIEEFMGTVRRVILIVLLCLLTLG